MKKGSVTRRDFIRLGAGLAAGGLASKVTVLEPERVGAAARPVAPSDSVRFAIVGTGIEGCKLLTCSLAIPGVECVAAADLYDGRHIAAREALGGKEIDTTREYRRVIDRKDIDVIICANGTTGIVHCRGSLGKDVYCEKPMSHTVEDGNSMVAAVRRYNRVCQVGSQRVSSVLYAKASENRESEKLGMVDSIQAVLDRNTDSGAWVNPIPGRQPPNC